MYNQRNQSTLLVGNFIPQFISKNIAIKQLQRKKVAVRALAHLRGQLHAWFMSNPLAGPPLSVLNIIIVLSSIPFSLNADVTFPTASSRADTIPDKQYNTTNSQLFLVVCNVQKGKVVVHL